MADEETVAEGTESEGGGSKGGGMKMILIVAVLMIVEGAGVFFLVSSMGGPKSVEATELAGLEGTGEEAPVEIELVNERFQNMQTGRVWEWRVEIFLRVRQKNVDEITAIQERDAATIKQGVALIFRRAHDRHLREPGLETITRQITTYLNEEVFGLDADGLPRVERVIIPECKGFPADA
jgi:flagellar basal body-associated protein FliL